MILRVAALLSLLTSPAFGQSVHGTITERSSGSRVPGAGVVLRNAKGRPVGATLADSTGSYLVNAPSPGAYSLSVQGRGLATVESPPITLSANTDARFDATLELEVAALPSVTVKDHALVHAPPGNPHKYDEFMKRKALGFGRFITRDEIDSRAQSDTRALFSNIPGIKFRIDGSKWYLRSQHCSGGSIPGIGAGVISRADPFADKKYEPMIFIDGIQQRRDDGFERLRELPPQSIEAIEVYQGAAGMPVEARGDSCFAIFVWLR